MAAIRVVVVGVLVGSAVLTALLTAFGWGFRDEPGADWLAATMALNTVWVVGALVRLIVDEWAALVVLEYALVPVATGVPVCWLGFVVAYTGHEHYLDRRGLAALWAVPAVVFAALLTTPVHDLYFAGFRVEQTALGTFADGRPGPMAWLNLVYFAVVVSTGLWLVARLLRDHERLYAGQALWLLVGTLVPVVMLGAELVWPPADPLPLIPLGFSLLGLAYARGLFNHRLLDLTPASRRIGIPEAFDDLGEGVVVVDTDRDVVAINERACRLFDCGRATVLGADLARVSPELAGLETQAEHVEVDDGGRLLSVTVSLVTDARDRRTGEALVVRDVTEDRRREQRLDVLNRVFRHNIRNTMNAVVSPTEMLAERLEDTDRDLAETAHTAGNSVVELSESVRAVEEMMTGPVEPSRTAVADVVDSAVATVRDDTAFDLAASVPSDLTVVTDPTVLVVVLEHVVENAATHAAAERPSVEVTAEPHADGCLVHVDDEGPGIPESELAVLRQGTETQLDHASGLGLWAIHWGVTRLGGAVRFGVTDSGTRATLWLPELADDGMPTAGAPAADDGATERSVSAVTTADDGWFGSGPPAR